MTIRFQNYHSVIFATALLTSTAIASGSAFAGGHLQSEQAEESAAAEESSATEMDHSSHDMGADKMEGMDHSTHEAKAEEMDHSSHDMANMDHGDHEMTPEMMQQLRDRIPLYQQFNDQQIMLNMRMMPPNGNMYVSDASVKGSIGILGISHGFSGDGNDQLRNEFETLGSIFPTALGYGMSMMSSSHMQQAVDQLTAAGAETIIIMPMVSVKYGSMMDQFNYIFGDRPEGAYADVPKIQTDAKLIMASTPADNPEIATILKDFALEKSTDPANEDVMIISHGPESEKDNNLEHEVLENLASVIRAETDFNSVQAFTIQDDAKKEIRAANVENMRKHIEESTAAGRKVIIVTNLLTSGNLSEKIRRDLAGLDFEMNTKGMVAHDRFGKWMERMVANASM